MAKRFERVMLADFENDVLDLVAGGGGVEVCQSGVEFAECVDLMADRGAALEGGGDEIAGVVDREADEVVELGIGLGRGAGGVALDEFPGGVLICRRRAKRRG